MNDTFRQPYLESNDSRLNISDESDVEITNRSFGQDYRGDLKSHRLINQSEFDKTEHGDEGDNNLSGTWAVQNSSLLTTKKGDEKAL